MKTPQGMQRWLDSLGFPPATSTKVGAKREGRTRAVWQWHVDDCWYGQVKLHPRGRDGVEVGWLRRDGRIAGTWCGSSADRERVREQLVRLLSEVRDGTR